MKQIVKIGMGCVAIAKIIWNASARQLNLSLKRSRALGLEQCLRHMVTKESPLAKAHEPRIHLQIKK